MMAPRTANGSSTLYSQWTSEIEASVTATRKQKARQRAHQAKLDAWVASGGKITYDYSKIQWVKGPKQPEVDP